MADTKIKVRFTQLIVRFGFAALIAGGLLSACPGVSFAEEAQPQLGEAAELDLGDGADLLASSDFQAIMDSAAYDVPDGVYDREAAYAILEQVNSLRASVGASALSWDSELEATALVRARELAQLFSHYRPDGSSCFTAFPSGHSAYGENIAMGYRSATSVFNGWKDSSGHYANMVSTSFKSVGMACFVSNGVRYWVQCFGGGSGDDQRFESAGSDDGTQKMLRLYNPNSGEHFYTASAYERDVTAYAGWTYEGVGWTAPGKSKTPVYRLYNKYAGDHHYTTSADEAQSLIAVGWTYEAVGWYSDDAEGVPLYRQYNPYAASGSHNYTTSKAENDYLVSLGWKAEGIAWYGVAQTDE